MRRAHDVLRLGRASRSYPSGDKVSTCSPHLHLRPRRLRRCTREADAKGDRVHMPAGVGLRRAGGRPLELLEQPGQAGLDGRGRRGRESRPHACSLVGTRGHTGRAHVLRPLSRAASVRQVPDSFGPRVFACAESRPYLCLGVSGMAADCSCSAW